MTEAPPPSPRAVIFVGPSMPGLKTSPHPRLDVRPPAACGDIIDALADGYTHIGLIDGYFESQLAIWHKEILFALDQGAVVLGAASMGALRAAELDQHGMRGVGRIYEAYASGELTRDDEVAVAHGPAELGYLNVSESLVNMRLTLDKALAETILSKTTHAHLTTLAETLFFKQRTWKKLFELAGTAGGVDESVKLFELMLNDGAKSVRPEPVEGRTDLTKILKVDQKNLDAQTLCQELIAALDATACTLPTQPKSSLRAQRSNPEVVMPPQFIHTEYLRNLLTDKGWTVTWHGTSYQTTRPTPETLMTLT